MWRNRLHACIRATGGLPSVFNLTQEHTHASFHFLNFVNTIRNPVNCVSAVEFFVDALYKSTFTLLTYLGTSEFLLFYISQGSVAIHLKSHLFQSSFPTAKRPISAPLILYDHGAIQIYLLTYLFI